MRKLFLLLFCIVIGTTSNAQIHDPVKWSTSTEKISDTEYDLIITDEMGCSDRDEITITITKFRPVSVPTAFTPNGDNVNDLLLVHGRPGTKVKTFRVFDRYGELVFQAEDFEVNDVNIGWDGSFRTEMLNPGTYVWYVEAEHIDGTKEVFKGHTTILH